MGFANTLLFLAEIGSKIGNVELDKKFTINFSEMKRLNNFTFVKYIPVFDEDKNYILVNGNKVIVGTILKRPLDLKEPLSKVEYHYAVVLGTSINGEEILIEMSKGTDINITNKTKFLVERFKEEQIEIECSPVRSNITREQLIERAKEIQFDTYHLLDFNCKIFAMYLVVNIAPPQRVKELKKFQLGLCDIAISGYKVMLCETEDEKQRAFIIKKIKESEKDKERLTLAITELEAKHKERYQKNGQQIT